MDAKFLEQLIAMEESLGDIEDASVRAAFQFFKNALEQAIAQIQALQLENQQLRDEVNRLKGEQGKPIIRPQTKAQDGDISSEKERSASKKPPLKKKQKKRR